MAKVIPDGPCARCGNVRKLTERGHCPSCRTVLQRNGTYAQEEEDMRHDLAAGFTVEELVDIYRLSEATIRRITC